MVALKLLPGETCLLRVDMAVLNSPTRLGTTISTRSGRFLSAVARKSTIV
jgi:hypothetical protein